MSFDSTSSKASAKASIRVLVISEEVSVGLSPEREAAIGTAAELDANATLSEAGLAVRVISATVDENEEILILVPLGSSRLNLGESTDRARLGSSRIKLTG